jgi:hypothetical protein
MNALIPVLCAIVGALTYALSTNAKIVEFGRLLFMASVFALMFAFTSRTVHLF